MHNTISACILLLFLAACQPPQPLEPTIPSPTPPVPYTATAAPEPAVSSTPGVTPSATPDTQLTPPMTREVAFAYHFWQAQVVAFGGLDPTPGGCNPCGETWIWGRNTDGKYWTKREPAHAPPARTGAAMGYDAERMVVVLFGGTEDQQAFDDTWLWDGQDWTQVHPDTAPSPRFNARMAYDSTHQQMVLWGGYGWTEDPGDYTFLSDTWTWDGKTWTEHEVSGPTNGAIPPPSMAYDGNLRKVVMWQSGEGLWTWDGAAWDKLPLVDGPDRFTDGQIGFDETRYYRRLVLRGSTSADPSPSAKTWTFDGTTWTLAEDSTTTDGNYQDSQMVYAFSHQALLFITPLGGKFGPYGLNVLAWNRSTWVDAATYEPPPPPVVHSNNMLDTSNRSNLAICVQVEDPASQAALAEFRDSVQMLMDKKLSQKPTWKLRGYDQFPYRVDAGCPGGPHLPESVDFPSPYKVHIYVMDAAAAREITKQLQAEGMNNPDGPQMYEMFAEGQSDSSAPVTFALYVTPGEMRDQSYLEEQLSSSLSLQQ